MEASSSSYPDSSYFIIIIIIIIHYSHTAQAMAKVLRPVGPLTLRPKLKYVHETARKKKKKKKKGKNRSSLLGVTLN